MDNKINKKRLSEFLHYEWIKILALALCACLLWHVVFISLGAVGNKLSLGQQFNIYYSSDMDGTCVTNINAEFGVGKTLSYEIQEYSTLHFDSAYETMQLTAYLSAGFGDIMICSHITEDKDGNRTPSYLECLIDYENSEYDFDTMYLDAYAYAEKFMLDKNAVEPLSKDNISDSAVVSEFNTRLKKDKRFKTDEQKAQGVLQEKARIEKLFENVKDLKTLLTYDIFVEYVKYDSAYNISNKQTYKDDYEKELAKGAKKYAIDFSKLPVVEGKDSITKYGVLQGETTGDGVVLLAFNSLKYQPALQFETLTVITTIIKNTTNILG